MNSFYEIEGAEQSKAIAQRTQEGKEDSYSNSYRQKRGQTTSSICLVALISSRFTSGDCFVVRER